MNGITQEELQNIRHLVGMSTGLCDKMNFYQRSVTDENEINLFKSICQSMTNAKDYLTNQL